jgi:hypothetical protein
MFDMSVMRLDREVVILVLAEGQKDVIITATFRIPVAQPVCCVTGPRM